MKLITANKLNRFWENGILPKLGEKIDKVKVLTTTEQVSANTNSENVASALVTKELINDLGIATRQDPDDPTKAQWRPRGSEGEWVNFTKPRRVIEQSFTNSSIPKSVTVDGVVYDYLGCKQVVFAMSNLNTSYSGAEAYLNADGTFSYGHAATGRNNNAYGTAIYIERMQ